MKEKELERLINLKQIEKELHQKGFNAICGIDEAGRGPLAGPVVVAGVIMPADSMIEGVNDSKKVSEKKRELLYDKIIEEENLEFVDMNYGPFIDLELNHEIIKSTPINEVIKDADVIISFTQLKYHEEATVTAAIKNIAMGYPPASIHGYPKKQTGIHEDLHGFIRCFAKKVPIDLSIISLDKAMIGTGPSDGMAVDTPGLVIASTDPVAADSIGARLLGFLPQAVCYLYGLYKDGLGEARPENMTILGVDLIEAEKIFSKCAYGKKDARLDKDKLKDIHGN